MKLSLRDFARRYLEMRTAQARYFRLKTPEALEASKALERALDKTARDILEDRGQRAFDFEEEPS